MFRRREAVPFAFVAKADSFRSNVTPPPKHRVSTSELVSRTLIGLTVAAGFTGALLFGMPSLETNQSSGHTQQSEASQGR
ncbi:hypothetical protein ACFRMN_31680 [Streptomyces sp. NPDC056835]|uniref:hypothetical protein n=1 Tax=Streptomyces sp. NPDC056835 TaxID=3345956 RepID=UPI0036CA558A